MKTPRRLLAVLAVFLMLNSCVHKVSIDDSEGSDVRAAFKSTVKINMKVKGKRANIITLSDEAPPDGSPAEIGWMGSGVVIENDTAKQESLIMTAAHVSSVEKRMLGVDEAGLFALIVTEAEITIETLDGKTCLAKQLTAEKEKDISVIVSRCLAGEPMELAEELPPIGAGVLMVGAPLGYHPKDMFISSDGRFVGVDKDSDESIITAASVGGFSGSPVIYNGKIIGILSKRTVDFEHISICVSLNAMVQTKAIAKEIWFLEKSLSL